MEYNVGDSVVVKEGVKDPDLGFDISGWQGRVVEIVEDEELIYVDWDSETLANIPMEIIEQCERADLEWTQMCLEPEEVEPAEARDTPEDAERMLQQIELKFRWRHMGGAVDRILEVLAQAEDPTDETQALAAWETFLSENLELPFDAQPFEHHDTSRLKPGDIVTVLRVSGLSETKGVMVKVKQGKKRYDYPLHEFVAVDEFSMNNQYLKDYSLWYANRSLV
ncbi:MAG: hypothetical protein D6675_01200 [Gemmatimonadetes bacterium]|nr:MAG: hypothetical protein D6675_01200 [Gemmatimonadota bacterium]